MATTGAEKFRSVDGSQIQEITADELIYLDEHSEQARINFAICHQNEIERQTKPEALENMKQWNRMNDEDLKRFIEHLNEWKAVAGRNFDGFPDSTHPYIQFYSKPPIRFEFQTRDEFEQVRRAIRTAGWCTIDLT